MRGDGCIQFRVQAWVPLLGDGVVSSRGTHTRHCVCLKVVEVVDFARSVPARVVHLSNACRECVPLVTDWVKLLREHGLVSAPRFPEI